MKNYHEVVKLSHDEQVEMYKNVPLKDLIEMLIECNRLLDMHTPKIRVKDMETLRKDALDYDFEH